MRTASIPEVVRHRRASPDTPDVAGPRSPRLGIGPKLAAITAVCLVLGYAVIIGLQVRGERERVLELADANFSAMTRLLASQMGGGVRFRRPEQIESVYADLTGKDSFIEQLQVVGVAGETIQGYGAAGSASAEAKAALQQTLDSGNAAASLNRRHLIYAEPIRFGPMNEMIGVLVVDWDSSGIEAAFVAAAWTNVILAGIGTIAVIGAVLLAIYRLVTSPLTAVILAMRKIAGKEYDTRISGTEKKDEVGDIAQEMTRFRDALAAAQVLEHREQEQARARQVSQEEQNRVVQEISTALDRLSTGDLTRKIESPSDNPFPSDYESLRTSFNMVIDRFGQIVAQVREIALGVRGGSDEIAQASSDISTRAETQAATLEQSAAALNELTESVRSTAALAGRAQKTGGDNRSNAEEGARIVREAVMAMRGIEQSSEQITRIIGVIEDIAFQTNLLALNAGVEAARAGDAGRGFAVVASEVRLLAQRAAESAREIKALIFESAAQVQTGSALVSRTGESLEEILRRAKEAASLVADIAVAASEQATGLNEINTGIDQLDQVTQQNAAVAEQTTAAANSLLQKSAELMSTLEEFQISAGHLGAGSSTSFPVQTSHWARSAGAA